jgi:hypothetical protein
MRDIICLSLDLPVGTKLSKMHVQQAMLGALLEHTTDSAAFIRFWRPELFFQDLEELLCKETIERFSCQFLPRLEAYEEEILKKPIGVDQIIYPADWKNDVFFAVADAMGIQEEKARILTQQFIKKTAQAEITPQKIIEHFAGQFAEEERADKYKKGAFGFCALMHSPLLQAWKCCLNQVREIRPKRLVEGKILHCVERALRGCFRPESLEEVTLCQKLFSQCMQKIQQGLRIRYGKTALTIQEISSKEEFEKYILQAVKAQFQPEMECAQTAPERAKALVTLYTRVQQWISEGRFLQEAISNFQYDKDSLSFPWWVHYPETTLDFSLSYLQKKPEVQMKFKAANVEEFFEQLLAIGSSEEKLEISSPRCTARFLRMHPSFVRVLKNDQVASSIVWELQNRAFNFGSLSESAMEKSIKWAEEHFVGEDEKESFQQSIQELFFTTSLDQFYKELFCITKKYLPVRYKGMEHTVESLFINYLFKEVFNRKKTLIEELQPIHIGNALEMQDGKEMHVCILKHPFERHLLLGSISKDNVLLGPCDSTVWQQELDVQIVSAEAL